MATVSTIRWGRIALAGLLAEACVFAIVFPVLHFFGQRAFLVSILIASFAMPFLFTLWLCRGVSSHFVLQGTLVGVAAAILYLILNHGQPEPLLYKVAHGLKIVGGMLGGVVASLSRRSATETIQS
jgi:hypothetical protein